MKPHSLAWSIALITTHVFGFYCTLGLALVKHFVDLHGGTVGMKPVEGGGLEVTCWLPAQAMRAVSAQRELLLSENVVPS